MKMKHLFGMVGAAGVFALSAAAYSELSIKTTEYELKTDKLSYPVTATVLSDLHFSVFGKDNCRLVDAVRKTKPDIILLAGDFFDYHNGKTNTQRVLATMKGLCSVAPVYMVPGNHDMRFDVQTGGDYKSLAQSVGVTVFDGGYADIEIKGQKVRIGGIFDHSIYIEDYGKRWYESPVYEYLKEFEKTESLSLLMMHRPNTFIYTDDKWNIDAVFSGHVHGGIWQIPFFRGVYAPEQGFLPEYDKGEYDLCGMKMFLSAGLEGYNIVPRLFNRVEILKITMHNTLS